MEPFRDQRIQLYLKALKLNSPFDPTLRPVMDIQNLHSLLLYCDTAPYSVIFKALYLTCFFSLLRLSNILPHSLVTFYNTRHLARGDFIQSGRAQSYYSNGPKPFKTGSLLSPFTFQIFTIPLFVQSRLLVLWFSKFQPVPMIHCSLFIQLGALSL